MEDSLNYDGLKHFYLLSTNLSELNNLKAKSGSIATIVDTGAEYMYEESSNQWHLQPSSGGGVSEQWVKDWVKANAITSYSTLPSPQDVGNNKAIWDETGKRLLTPNGNEFVELLPAIRKVNAIVNTGNENVFYKKTGGIFYERARVNNPLKNPVFYKITDPENFIVLDWGGVRVGETSYMWEAVDNTYISSWINSGYIAQCTHLDPKAEIWGGIDDSTWIYNSIKYSGATIADDELVYIDSFGLIREVTDNSKIGDLSNLHTTDKSSIVNAINEIINNAIIDVTELPTTNINKKALYRIVGTGGNYTALYFYDDKDNNFKSIPSMEYLSYVFGTAFENIDVALHGINTNLSAVKNAVAFEWIKGAIGSGINIDRCIFNLISSDVIGTDTQPIVKKESFVCNFTDPVTSSNTYGECETTQYFIRHLTGRVNYIVFQQVVTKYVQNASNTLKMMRRGSYVISDENFNFFTDVTNLTSTDITWGSWVLTEYPTTAITKESIVDEGAINFRIKSSIVFVNFSGLVIDEFSNPSAVLGTLPAGIQAVLSETKHYIGNNNGDMHGLNVTYNGNLQLWKKTGDVFPLSLSGTIMFPIGY